VPHGFRTTFKTWCVEKTNFENYVSEAALERRRLMEAWAGYCALEPAKAEKLDNVVQLHA